MVKVSFNSALAQKEAAKKEEENSQVLILPPDAKVRAAGAPTLRGWRGGAGRSALLRSAALGGAAPGGERGGDAAELCAPLARGDGPRAGRGKAAQRCAPPPHRLTLLKWLTESELLGFSRLRGSLWWFRFSVCTCFAGVLFMLCCCCC